MSEEPQTATRGSAKSGASASANGSQATLAKRDAGSFPVGSEGNAPRLSVEHMPQDFSISVAGRGGLEKILFGDHDTKYQSMRGFDPTYTDIVDYIVRITHRIWEEKDLGYIYESYRSNARVTDGYGLKANREQMVSESISAVQSFPDAMVYADEVIWAGDDVRGFHTSHRVVTVATHTGYSELGAPTGRRFNSWSLANCVALDNEIFEEWLLDNNGSIILQLGLDLFATARALADNTEPARLDVMTGEVERLLGQGRPRVLAEPDGDAFDVEQFVRYVLHNIWNWRNLNVVEKAYAINVRGHGATEREYYGRGDVKSFVLSLLTMFPDLAHAVDEVYWMGNDRDGYKVSVRWTAIGTHRGHGIYGAPTGRRVRFWGISQLLIRNGVITEEWTMFNEFELIQQLVRSQPAL